ncbi:MAG: SPASM domain-containing protein [Deltaproteobacteria bacterium]|nr:SPASM domain-containing protein [Deltaproteobacteria bacterium]
MYFQRMGRVGRGGGAAPEEAREIAYYREYLAREGRFPRFTQVLLETRTDCNRRCAFCPQGHARRPFQQMSWEVFRRVIDELVRLEFAGRIALFMTNEPLLDERLPEMLAYARAASPRFFLDINTNGMILSVDKVDQLLAAGLDNLNIQDYRTPEDRAAGRKSPHIAAVLAAYGANPKLDYVERSTQEVLSSRAGHVPKTAGGPVACFCSFPFRKLAVAPDGEVVLCCMDYHYQERLGNVMAAGLEEIWQGPGFRAFREALLKRERPGLCAKCDECSYPPVSAKARAVGWLKRALDGR